MAALVHATRGAAAQAYGGGSRVSSWSSCGGPLIHTAACLLRVQVVLTGRRKFFYLLDVESQAVDRLASLRLWRDEKSFESFVTSQHSPQPCEYGASASGRGGVSLMARLAPSMLPQHAGEHYQRQLLALPGGAAGAAAAASISCGTESCLLHCCLCLQWPPSLATRATCLWLACTPSR